MYSIPTGNVGIGTATPGAKLDVRGSSSTFIHIRSGSGAADNAGIGLYHGTSGKWGIYNNNADSDKLYLVDDGDTRLIIDQTGNVGIGTTTPTYLLDVNGNVNVGDTLFIGDVENDPSPDSVLTIVEGKVFKAVYDGGSGGDAWLLTGNSGTVSGTNFLGTTDDQALDFRVNNDFKLRITSRGQLETYGTEETGYILTGQGAGENQTGIGTDKPSLGGHKPTLGDRASYLGDAEPSLGGGASNLGDAEASLGGGASYYRGI